MLCPQLYSWFSCQANLCNYFVSKKMPIIVFQANYLPLTLLLVYRSIPTILHEKDITSCSMTQGKVSRLKYFQHTSSYPPTCLETHTKPHPVLTRGRISFTKEEKLCYIWGNLPIIILPLPYKPIESLLFNKQTIQINAVHTLHLQKSCDTQHVHRQTLLPAVCLLCPIEMHLWCQHRLAPLLSSSFVAKTDDICILI